MHRRNRRQGKTGRREKKDGRLSSQNRAEADERKQKAREKDRKRKHKVSTGGTAVGAKPGRTKGNKQKAEYKEPGKKTRETGFERTGKTHKAKAEGEHRKKAAVRQSREERGKEETEAE